MAVRRPSRLLRIAALAAVLLLAQSAEFFHSDLDDSHAVGEVCALCVGLATLGAGNVSASLHVHVVLQRPEGIDYVLTHRFDRRVERPFARGPPQAS